MGTPAGVVILGALFQICKPGQDVACSLVISIIDLEQEEPVSLNEGPVPLPVAPKTNPSQQAD